MKKLCLFILVFIVAISVASAVVEVETTAGSQGILTLIEGQVYDIDTGNGIDGITITVYCQNEGNVINTATTVNGGYFSGWTINMLGWPDCGIGDTAGVSFIYNNQSYGDTTIVTTDDHGYGYANINVGVPEFSTLTLGLAVILGCLGLIVMRKQH